MSLGYRAALLNQRFGVGFWLREDAEGFARTEHRRTGVKHDVIEHPIHGTKRVVFDVAPSVSTKRKAA